MDTDDTACKERYKDLRKTMNRWFGGIGAIGVLLVAVGVLDLSVGRDAKAGLDKHTARQNGTLEAINFQFEAIQLRIKNTEAQFASTNSQLSSLRTYHSTLRGEMKARTEQIQDQRAILDELLLRSQPVD